MTNTEHIFAFHVTGNSLPVHLFKVRNHTPYVLHDKVLAHRLVHILRCVKDQPIQLFDQLHVVYGRFQEVQRKEVITFLIDAVHPIHSCTPPITILLPLLKREAFENALYTCVEMGANVIQPIMTKKSSQRELVDSKRALGILIAAAEQSKQYRLPALLQMRPLDVGIATMPAAITKLYLDPEGTPLFETMNSLKQEQPKELVLTFGPEGDFTEHEKTLLKQAGFKPCSLTPTILRAPQALAIGLGALRSML